MVMYDLSILMETNKGTAESTSVPLGFSIGFLTLYCTVGEILEKIKGKLALSDVPLFVSMTILPSWQHYVEINELLMQTNVW